MNETPRVKLHGFNKLDEIAQLQYVRYLLYENGEGAGGVYRIH